MKPTNDLFKKSEAISNAIQKNMGIMKALPISNFQLSQKSIEQEYLNYKEELDSFDSHAHYLTNENLEKLILFIKRKLFPLQLELYMPLSLDIVEHYSLVVLILSFDFTSSNS